MANILETIHHEIPEFPVGAGTEEQLQFLFECIGDLNMRLKTTAEDAPDGASGTFTSADGTPKTITVVDGIITSIV